MRHHRSSEAGSTYVITLLALVVLTILALSLALVTQTEVQVGANEKTVNRTFYAADSGLHIWLADLLVSQKNPASRTVVLNRISVGLGSPFSSNVADRVTVANAALVNKYPCNWCPSAENSDQQYFHEDYVVSSTAQRISWSGNVAPPADATVLGQKTLTATFRMEPVAQDVCQSGKANQNGACGSSGSGNN
jgi:Tfp pilus assembly protein PilX